MSSLIGTVICLLSIWALLEGVLLIWCLLDTSGKGAFWDGLRLYRKQRRKHCRAVKLFFARPDSKQPDLRAAYKRN